MEINGRKIGGDEAPYIVAEIGASHAGRLENAFRLIEAAKEAGADAVKLQAYEADAMTLDSDKPDFIVPTGPWAGRRLYELYKSAETPLAWMPALFGHAKQIGITCFASVFDQAGVDALEALDCPAYKIASFELVDIPLIRYVAETGKPIILSNGMADPGETWDAMMAAKKCDRVLLHCVSNYPALVEEANLVRFQELQRYYGGVIGISDHTLGVVIPIMGAALGMVMLEKHLRLADVESEDSNFSMTPSEFDQMGYQVRQAHEAMKRQAHVDSDHRPLRRSLWVVSAVKAGEKLTAKNVKSLRPGLGMSPKQWAKVRGSVASMDLEPGTPLRQQHFKPPVKAMEEQQQ